jgi:hypothetical protein
MGRAAVRLCNLVVQSPWSSEGTISAGGAEGADRERNRSVGARLPQVVQERDSVIEQAIETAAFMLDSEKSRGPLPGDDLRT